MTNVSPVVSYLDIPDLTSLSRVFPQLTVLTSDPILHRNRLRLTAPSRVSHSLFGTSPTGILFRPSVGELLQRGVMRGLGIERRWRTGGYCYSPRVSLGHLALVKVNSPITDGVRLRECSETAPSSCPETHFNRPPRPSPVLKYQYGCPHESRQRKTPHLRRHRRFEGKQTRSREPNPFAHHSKPSLELQARPSQSSRPRSERHRSSIRQTQVRG